MFLGDRFVASTAYSTDLSVLFDNNTLIESPTNNINFGLIKAVTGTATAMGAILI
jgi:spore coat protein U-like protein